MMRTSREKLLRTVKGAKPAMSTLELLAMGPIPEVLTPLTRCALVTVENDRTYVYIEAPSVWTLSEVVHLRSRIGPGAWIIPRDIA